MSLVLLKDGEEIGRTPVRHMQVDQNYELKVRIDMNRPGTTLYKDSAVPAEGLFSLVVEMNGSLFYPIEVTGNLTAGKGSERVRLDLNLGADSDLDGLPDVWEQWQLYQAGYHPNAQGEWDLNLINREGDLDEDGLSNYREYIAGTFAGDATETFRMSIKEMDDTKVRFEFFAITGKTYMLERSVDAETWTRIPFSVGTPGLGAVSFQADSVGILSAFAIPTGNANEEFYRLSVR